MPDVMVETQQVKLQLTEDPEILSQLRANGKLKMNRLRKREEMVILFNAIPFVFSPGVTQVVGRRVANSLRRDSAVIIGEHLTGEIVAAIEEIGNYDMALGYEEQRKSVTECPVCRHEFETIEQLGQHLSKGHKEDRPDLYVSPEEGKDLDERVMERDPVTGLRKRKEIALTDSSAVG